MSQRNVVSEVVGQNLCIGCGLCAGVCPSGNLAMKWNEYGEYNPVEKGHCMRNCSLCLNVCPFLDGNDNEDILGEKLFKAVPGIKHATETGYYLESYVGYSPNRENAASGGMTSFFLERLLQEGQVDKVVCVSPNDDPDALFQYRVMETPEEIRQSTGSAYYPVQLADVVKYILEHEGYYAITALPCFAKALRLAAENLPVLKKRIKFILGLVCGQLKSSFYTSYIASLAGVNEPLKQCYYRGKDPNQPANNYSFTCEGIIGKPGRIRWNQGVSQVWITRWFTPIACNFCDDIFGEVADAVFMDAWLPGYRKDPKGTSLILVRNNELAGLLKGTDKQGVTVEPISISEVIKSQRGVVRIKREQLSYRLYKKTDKGEKTIKKRVLPKKWVFSPLERKEVEILDKIQDISRKSIPNLKRGNESFGDIQRILKPHLRSLKRIRQTRGVFTLPVRAIRKAIRIIKKKLNK